MPRKQALMTGGLCPFRRTTRTPKTWGWPGSALLLALLATAAGATPIPVDNASFEELPMNGLPFGCGAGCSYSEDVIPYWLNTPFLGLGLTSGQFRPGTGSGNTTYFTTLSDGPTSAYTSTGCIEQTVGATVQPGVTYTLLVDVGWRNDASPTGVPRLRVNDTYYDGVGVPVQGGWSTFTATYVGTAQDAGLPITICLTSLSVQGNFDNVRLSDSTDPAGVGDPRTSRPVPLQARPNPFSGVTQVRFSLERGSMVALRVFDVSGREIRTLLHGAALEAGAHEVSWDGRDDAGIRQGSGLYFLAVDSDAGRSVERVLLIR